MRALVIAGGQAPSPALVRRYAGWRGADRLRGPGAIWQPRRRGWSPDLVVGDFDSMERPPGGGWVRVPVMKDMTDTQAAVDLCIERGAREVVLLEPQAPGWTTLCQPTAAGAAGGPRGRRACWWTRTTGSERCAARSH